MTWRTRSRWPRKPSRRPELTAFRVGQARAWSAHGKGETEAQALGAGAAVHDPAVAPGFRRLRDLRLFPVATFERIRGGMEDRGQIGGCSPLDGAFCSADSFARAFLVTIRNLAIERSLPEIYAARLNGDTFRTITQTALSPPLQAGNPLITSHGRPVVTKTNPIG